MSSQVRTSVRKGKLWHYCGSRNTRWMNDSRVTQYLSVRGKFTWWKGFRYWLQHTQNGDLLLAIYHGPMHVGNCGFFGIKQDRAELRISIGDTNIWGNGVGSSSVCEMLRIGTNAGINNVWLHVHPDNLAAIKIYEKNDFVYLGDVITEQGIPQREMTWGHSNNP